MEAWQMTDEQLGKELLSSYDAIGKEGASTVYVWRAQQARREAVIRLVTYATRLGLKIGHIENKPFGR